MEPTIFLGLVTHRRTRFPLSAGPDGLVARIEAALAEQRLNATVSRHADDHHDEHLLPLSRAEVLASIDAELDVERRWRAYVDPKTSHLSLAAFMAIRRFYRRLRLAPAWKRGHHGSKRGAAMLRRLVNIELAHLHLLRQAMEQHADWALILEDDAQTADPETFSAALAAFIRRQADHPKPAYLNVSRSFSHERLKLGHHLTAIGQWDADVAELSSDIPLTNTVCAILYRVSFLDKLVPALESVPLSPVLPIDWKLNAALLALHETGEIGPGDCWFLDPAPIVQGSMHAADTAPLAD